MEPISMEKKTTGRRLTIATSGGGAERERAFAHPGRARHDEVRGLQPEQHVVELGVPGGDTGQRVGLAVERLELVDRRGDGVEHPHQRLRDSLLGHLEDHRLGAVDGHRDVVRLRVRGLRNLAGHRDEPAQQRELAHDLGVVTGVRGRGGGGLDGEQRALAAEGLEQAGAPKLLGHGHRVDGLTLLVERPDRIEDVTVRGPVEVAGVDPGLDRGGDRVPREEHGAEQRLLGLEVVRRHPLGTAPADPLLIDGLDHAAPSRRVGRSHPGPRMLASRACGE
jgi:hypothetical protein